MRCSRCQNQVMPGLTECPACGQPVGEASPPPETMPRVGHAPPDLLGQRRAVRRNALRYSLIELNRGRASELLRSVNLPPIVDTLGGMAFGAWFFRHGRREWGAAVAVVEALLLALLVAQVVGRFDLPLYTTLVLVTLTAAGGLASYQVIVSRGHRPLPAAVMAFFSPLLIISFVYFAGFVGFHFQPWWRWSRLTLPNGVAEELPRQSSVFMQSASVDPARLHRGMMLFDRWRLYPLFALPGDSVEVSNCRVLVNGKDVTAVIGPMEPRLRPRFCATTIERFSLPDQGCPFLMAEYGGNGNGGFRFNYTPWSRLWRVRMIYWPPSQWRYFP